MSKQAGDRLRDYVTAKMTEQRIASVSELARQSGVSRDTFQAWWRGRPPQRGTAELVARVLGVTYGDIIQAREGRTAGVGASDGPAPADYSMLVAAINRLAAALEGRTEQLAPETAEGIAQARARVAEDGLRPSPRRR